MRIDFCQLPVASNLQSGSRSGAMSDCQLPVMLGDGRCIGEAKSNRQGDFSVCASDMSR